MTSDQRVTIIELLDREMGYQRLIVDMSQDPEIVTSAQIYLDQLESAEDALILDDL